MTDKTIKIEYEFFVKSVPDLSHANKTYIPQAYLTDTNDFIVFCLQKKDEEYCITVKSGSAMVRLEREISIDQTQFERLWPEQADSFQPADWFRSEVTSNQHFNNKVLAMNPLAIEGG
jgi:CYTH domain-containing protein